MQKFVLYVLQIKFFTLLNNRVRTLPGKHFYRCEIFEVIYHLAARLCGQPNRKIRPAKELQKFGLVYRLKVTSKIELKKTSRMAAKAGGAIPPTEQGLNYTSS